MDKGAYPNEQEVVLLDGTLLEVIEIKETVRGDHDFYIITLRK